MLSIFLKIKFKVNLNLRAYAFRVGNISILNKKGIIRKIRNIFLTVKSFLQLNFGPQHPAAHGVL
jgi:hypothetical protein